MKKILAIIILLTITSYSQVYILRDSSESAMNRLRLVTGEIDQAVNDVANSVNEQINQNARDIEILAGYISALQDSIALHRAEIEAIKSGGTINIPDPLAPDTLLATADNDTSKITITWTNPPSTSTTPDSFRVYMVQGSGLLDVVFTWIASVPYGTNTYTATKLNTSTQYAFRLRSLVTGTIVYLSEYSATVSDTTYTPTVATNPDLAGYLIGTSTADFTTVVENNGHTFTADGDYYIVTMDSSNDFNESSYGLKTFTGQSDSIFVGVKVIIPSFGTMKMHTAKDDMGLISISDGSTTILDFGFGDTDSTRVPNSWRLRYRDSTTTGIYQGITTNFTSGTKDIKIAWKDLGSGMGVLQVFVNDTLLWGTSNRYFSPYTIGQVSIGNTGYLASSDYVINNSFQFDSLYVDSRGFLGEGAFVPPVGGGGGVITYDYIVSPWGGGDTLTIKQASIAATAGDTVLITAGEYDISVTTGSVVTFGNSGTSDNPIVFIGVYDGLNPETVDGADATYIKCRHTTNGNLNISGSYVEFHNMVIEQAVNTAGGVQQVINVSGDHVTIDSCVIREPSGISGEHTIIVKPSAQYFTLRNSYLWNSGRTFIWIEASATDAAHYSLMENNIFTGMDNHYAFQIMPLTNVSSPPNNIGAIVRNNLFIDVPYSSAVYIRNCQDFKIYNNVFLRAGGKYGSPLNVQTHEAAPYDTLDANGLIAYNTYVADTYSGGAQEFVHHIGNMNNVKLYNNLCVFSSVNYVYRTGAAYNTIAAGKRWQSDYNLFYATNDPTWTGTKSSVWYNYSSGVSTSTYSWAQTKSVLGFDANTIVGQLPTFISTTDFRPLSGSSPQVGTGTDLSSYGITTDKDGNLRDATNPTIGAYEYVP